MKYLCIALIRFYRKYLSRLKRTPTCRFTPTCSAYALEAYQKRGFFVGTALAVWRILRCNPYNPGGYDPVPEHGFRYRAEIRGVSLAYLDAGEGDMNDICEPGSDERTVGSDESFSREEKTAPDGSAGAEKESQ